MWDGMAGNMDLIWGKREAKYFLRGDWTGGIRLIRLDKFAVARKFVKWGEPRRKVRPGVAPAPDSWLLVQLCIKI
jgi:hypothetical protein